MKTNSRPRRTARHAKARPRWPAWTSSTPPRKKGRTPAGAGPTSLSNGTMQPSHEKGGRQARIPPRA